MSMFSKKREQERKEQEELNKKQFMSDMSFAVRNPLNTICGVSEIVRKNVEAGKEKEIVLSYVDILIDAAIELQQVIDNAFENYDKSKYNLDDLSGNRRVVVDYSVLENLRILVVEDSSVSQLIAKEMLESKGAIVTLCDSGNDALELFEKSITGTYDVIFMDINMPGMDGYETTDAIRNCEHPQAKEIPIIAMTAEALTEDIQMALKAGMNAHISKPIAPDKIINAINSVR